MLLFSKHKKKIQFIILTLIVAIAVCSHIKKPTVSVVMPVYNRAEKFLPEAIISILSQTYSDFELIIIDDGSTDKTLQVIQLYQKKDTRIRLIQNKKNIGISASRTKGNDVARGKYIVVMDSDDRAYPYMLEYLVTFMENHPEATVAYPARDGYHDFSENKAPYYYHQPLYAFFFNNSIQNVGNIFRRDFIEKNKIKYNSHIKAAEDYDFWAKIVIAGGEIHAATPRISLILMRLHKSNPHDYYRNMIKTASITSQKLLSFYNISPNEQRNKCLSLKKIIQSSNNFLNQEEQQKGLSHYCPQNPNAFLVKHLVWHDYFIIEKNQKEVCRYSNQHDYAQIINWDGKKLKIKWKDWGIENFLLNDKHELEFIQK